MANFEVLGLQSLQGVRMSPGPWCWPWGFSAQITLVSFLVMCVYRLLTHGASGVVYTCMYTHMYINKTFFFINSDGQPEIERTGALSFWLISQMATMVCTGPGQSWEPGIRSGPPVRVAGPWLIHPVPLCAAGSRTRGSLCCGPGSVTHQAECLPIVVEED